MAAFRLAVDLGSSNTAAVLERSGSVRPLLFDGSELLPSAVFALGEVYTVSEAVAAAAYFSTVLGVRSHRPLVVVDIGAGTTDVAVVSCGTRVGVLASAGMDLGGLDIDAALVDHLARQCLLPGIDDPGYDRVPLLREVRAARESLSRASYTPLRVAGQPAASHLTRAELEAAAEPILTRVGEFAAEVIATAALTTDRLAGVLLVGGGSRIPQAASILHQRLGIPPTTVERPETVVVEGALRVPRTSLTAPAAGTAAAGTSELPAVTPTPGSGRAPRRRGWLRPGLLVGVLLCFVLPFATVSCGLPDGYGRADPGGTTTYR